MRKSLKVMLTAMLMAALVFSVGIVSACSSGTSEEDAAKIEELTNQLTEAEKKLKEAEDEVKKLGEQIEAQKMTIGGTDNIDYMLADDGNSYIAIGPNDSTTDSHFEIATVYQGLPVTEIGEQAFSGYNEENLAAGTVKCVIRSVSIPSTVTTIGKKAFAYDQQLVDITFGGPFDPLSGEEALQQCGFTLVKFPVGQTGIPNGFLRENHSLETVILPEGVTWIGNGSFFDCSNIKDLYFPESITRIEANAFWGSFYITIANFPTNLEYLGKEAFYYCVNIAAPVVFGENFKFFGGNAFYNSRSIPSITFTVTEGWYSTQSENTTPGASDTTAMTAEQMTGDLKALLTKPGNEQEGAMGEYFFIRA